MFLVFFASCYYLLARAEPASFNAQHLTRTDTLYFTLTVFSSVGFGDINATSQVARGVVMVQMVLNLVLLGLGVRVLTRAVEIGAARRRTGHPSAAADAFPAMQTGGACRNRADRGRHGRPSRGQSWLEASGHPAGSPLSASLANSAAARARALDNDRPTSGSAGKTLALPTRSMAPVLVSCPSARS